MYILCGALTIFILMMFLSFNNITEIFGVIRTADVNYVLITVLLLVVYALLSPLTLCMLAKSKKTAMSFKNIYVIGMTEHFFNGITPFATGGQPFEVYAMNKLQVKPSESTGLLMMNFIIHMLVTNVFAVCSLFYYSRLISSISNFQAVVIIGFAMNFLVLVLIISLATSKHLRRLLEKLLLLLCKIKFLRKFLQPKVPMLAEYFEQVQVAFKDLFKKKCTFLLCILVKIIMMAVYYAMTFYILRALHIDVGYDQMFYVICGTSFAITMVVWLPTPGSSGGIELAFKSIFVSIAGGTQTVAFGGMLLWRLVSYYLLMILSLGFYVYFEIYYSKVFKKRCLEQTAESAVESEAALEFSAVNIETLPEESEGQVCEERALPVVGKSEITEDRQ